MLRMMIVCGAWAASGLALAAALCGAAACWPERAAAARWAGAVVGPALCVVLAGLVVLSLVAVAVWPDDPFLPRHRPKRTNLLKTRRRT